MHIKHKLIAVVALAIFVLPGISLAQTQSVAGLQAEIQSLLAELQTLEGQAQSQAGSASSVTSANAWCYTFSVNLSVGATGAGVTALQTALQKNGESVTVNGTFDDQTAAGVTAFQEKYASIVLAPSGLKNGTGYAGKGTRAELNALFGCGSTSTPSGTVPQPSVVLPAPISTTPSIGFTAPIANEVFPVGSEIVFQWQGGTVAGIKLIPVNGTASQGIFIDDPTLNGVPDSSGQFSYFVASSIPAGEYYALFYGVSYTGSSETLGSAIGQTPDFYISAVTAAPTGGIYPAGGETLTNGQNGNIATIQWNTDIFGSIPLSIYLRNPITQANVKEIVQSIPNNGAYVWSSDPTIPSGSYEIYVTAYPAANEFVESGAFNLVTGGSTPSPTSSLSIASVIGLQQAYQSNQPISFTLNGIQLPGNKPADGPDGFNVQAYMSANGGITNVAGENGSYNAATELWDVTLIAPSSTGTYNLSVTLYCGGDPCSSQYPNGSYQVSKNFAVAISPGAPSSTIGSVPTVTLTANPTAITAGQSTALTWSSTNATYCTSSGGSGSDAWAGTGYPNDTIVEYPTVTTIYTVACTGPGGTSNPASVTVNINTPSTPATPYILAVSPTSGTTGTTVMINGSGFVSTGNLVDFAGSQVASVNSTNGTSLLFVVPSVYPSSCTSTACSEVSAPIEPGTYSIAVVSNGETSNSANFVVKGSTLTIAPPALPTVTFSMPTAPITLGQSFAITWSTTNATACTAIGPTGSTWNGSKATSGSQSVTPSAAGVETEYMLQCSGSGGTQQVGNTITVNPVVIVTPPPVISPAPTISSISPTSTAAGNLVSIFGNNFTTATPNTILLNGYVVAQTTNTSESLSFRVPSDLVPTCSAGESCSETSIPVYAGESLLVTVTNANGTSKGIPLTVTATSETFVGMSTPPSNAQTAIIIQSLQNLVNLLEQKLNSL